MRAFTVASVLALSTAIAAPGALAQEEEPGVTTATWHEPDAPLDLQWHVLALPEYVVELLFSPVGVLVANVEKYRIDKRLYDLLRNDAGTIKFTPKLKLAVGDGFGGGGNLSFKEIFGSESKLKFGGLARLDGDYEVAARYTKGIAAAEGRVLELSAAYEVDQNMPYYGIGNDTPDDKHVMRQDGLDTMVGFDIIGAGVVDLGGQVQFGLRRGKLSNGTDKANPGVADMGSTVMPPPEFDETVVFPWFASTLRFDKRDNLGRPTRGYIAQLSARFTQDTSDQKLSAMSGRFEFEGFIPLLPDRRVLMIGGGIAGSIRARDEDTVPVHAMVTLGRKNHLHGYGRGRFRDELGWWANVEYRWPIWEYLDQGVALSPLIFFDAGRVASEMNGLFDSDIHYDGGIGIRGAHDTLELLRLYIGMSPEGLELDFGIGADL